VLTSVPAPLPQPEDAGAHPRVYLAGQREEAGMNSDWVLRMTSDLLWTGLLVSMPILGLTMLVGLAVSVVQVITQVQEMSLSFVPKLVAAGAALIAFGPWMLRTLCAFVVQLWSRIPQLL
jgi:flagellar biosynthetic protein FliQ